MKVLLLLAVLAGASYAGWQRFERWRDTAPDVEWGAGQLGREVDESYLVFDAGPVDGRLFGVEGPGGASLLVMTARIGYHFWKTNPDLVVNCRTPGRDDMVSSLAGLVAVSETPRGRRELDALVASYKARAASGGKRLCLKLRGQELKDERIRFGGTIPGQLLRVSRLEAMDCGELVAGM